MTDLDFAQSVVQDAGLPKPTFVVFSGGGLHFYWMLDEPITDLARWTRIQKGLIRKCKAAGLAQVDEKIHDAPRIMRLPGTINHKNGKVCAIVVANVGVSYDVAEFPEVAESDTLELPPMPEGSRTLEDFLPSKSTQDFINGKTKPGSRNSACFSAACELIANGIAAPEVERLCVQGANRCGLPAEEAAQAVRSALSKQRTLRGSLDADAIESVLDANVAAAFGESTMPTKAVKVKPVALEAQTSTPQGEAVNQQAAKPEASAGDVRRERGMISNGWSGMVATHDGKLAKTKYAKPIADVRASIIEACDGWPKVVGSNLFTLLESGGRYHIRYISKPQELFAFLHQQADVYWIEGEGRIKGASASDPHSFRTAVTKQEILEHLINSATERFKATSELPHVPPMADTYYVPLDLPAATGNDLRRFVSMLNVATDDDRLLALAATLTPMWGGDPGTRPGFLFEADGPGAGKTATVNAIARLYGGAHMVSDSTATWTDTMKAMFSGSNAATRIILFDNAKQVVEGQAIEAAITAPTISGWKAYFGTIVRPNDLTVMITANGAALSADMSQRVVPIKMGAPKKGGDWIGEMNAFIDERRWNILADIRQALQAPSKYVAAQILGDRFGGWQAGVLAKIDGADRLSKTIVARRETVDFDSKRGEEIIRELVEMLDPHGIAGKVDVAAYKVWRRLVSRGYWDNPKRLDVDARGIADCMKWTQKKVARWPGILTQLVRESGDPKRVQVPAENDPTRMISSALWRLDVDACRRLWRFEAIPVTDSSGNEIPI
jgi:hypothetical protein